MTNSKDWKARIADSNRRRRIFSPDIAKARCRYRTHRSNAAKRGVEFLLTFEEWWQIWQDSGKWPERGAGPNKYCMSRYGDTGAYAVGNVFINRFAGNTSEGQAGKTKPISQRAKMSESARARKRKADGTFALT